MASGDRKFGAGELLYYGAKDLMEKIGKGSSGMAGRAGKAIRNRQSDMDSKLERAAGASYGSAKACSDGYCRK